MNYIIRSGVVVAEHPRYSREAAPEGCELYRSRRTLTVGQPVPRRRGDAWPEGWVSRGGFRVTEAQAEALLLRARTAGTGLDAYVATAIETAAIEGRDITPAASPVGPTRRLRIVCGPDAADWMRRRAAALGCTLASLVRGLLVGERL